MKNTKFIAMVLGLVAAVVVTLAGKMDGIIGGLIGSVVLGYMGSNVANTRAALANGKNGES